MISRNFKGEYKQAFNYIVSSYEFRYNLVTASYEYRKLHKGKPNEMYDWKNLEDRMIEDIKLELTELEFKIPDNKFNMFIESQTVSPDYDPFEEYFDELPVWNGKIDYLQQLTETISTQNQEFFKEALKKFLIGAIDCLLEEDAVNDTCLVFQSSQGLGKTRWMRKLLPKKFRAQYLYEGSIDTRNKDHTMYLSQYWFIHLDELESLRSNDINAIKSYITRQRISERKSYGRNKTRFIRRASFLGSVNDDKFLTDITGSRRWLVFTTKDQIDYEHKVDIDGLWSQIYKYWKDGVKHWFDIDEIKKINDMNEEYREISLEEEQILELYEFPDDPIHGEYMSASDVMIQMHKYRPMIIQKLSNRTLGKILRKYKKKEKKVNGFNKYLVNYIGVKPVDPYENQNQLQQTTQVPEKPFYGEGDDLPF